MSIRSMLRRGTAVGVAVAVLTGALPAVADAAEPGWRQAVAASATSAANGGPVALKERLVPALRPHVEAPLEGAELDTVAEDAATRYVDDARLRDGAAVGDVYGHDRGLAGDLQVLLNRDPRDDTVAALNDLLAAGRDTAAAMLADLTALTRSPAVPKAVPHDTNALSQASSAYDQGVAAWRRADAVGAVEHFSRSADRVWDVLDRYGLRYAEDADLDGDGVPDLIELRFGADPRVPDTDADGLSDLFEILHGTGFHLPNTADTDGDGTRDPAEDVDGDALNALGEQLAGSNPLTPDSDGDTLSDGAEVRAGTDPLDPDSDDDGVLDGADVHSASVDGADGSVVTVTGTGDLAGNLTVESLATVPRYRGAPGQVSTAIDITLDPAVAQSLSSATITLPYDPAKVGGAESDLRLFYYEPTLRFWVPASDAQSVDAAANTVTATVGHFSIYAIFNIANWRTTFTGLGGTCASRGGGGSGSTVYVDVAFVIDSSGSMTSNDPQNLRRTAAKNFVDALLDQDRGAVVDFDSSARLFAGLTSNKTTLKAAIDRIDSSGGTNIGAGVRVGLDELATNTDATRAQIMILLTDGDGSYDHSLTDRAARNKVTIYTIGLGRSVPESLLRNIADRTGGQYYPVANAADLPQVFREIEEDTGDDGRDTDGDGLSDCLEEKGVTDGSGLTFTSDPRLADTDGDGLSDGDEMGGISDLAKLLLGPLADQYTVRVVESDPRLADTDADGLTDPEEADLGTDPRSMETDGDGLGDYAEAEEIGTDPTRRNTDGDKRDDGYEDQNPGGGFDPLFFDEELSKWDYAKDFALGVVCPSGWGFCERDTLAWFAGTLTAGFAAVKDVVDAIAQVFQGEFVAAGISLVTLIPVVGDAGSVVSKGVKFIKRVSSKAGATLAYILKIDKLPLWAKLKLLDEVDSAAVKRIRGHGIGDDALVRLVSRRVDFRVLDDALEGASAVRKSPRLYSREKDAENYLRGLDADNLPRQKGFPQPNRPAGQLGTKGYRYPDVYNPVTRTAIEVKNGFVKKTPFIEAQVAKDVALRNAGKDVQRVEWHFFPKADDTIGPDAGLLKLLKDNDIPYVIHTP